MRATTIDDVEEMLWVLQDEIRRSEEARYDHRLHSVLLVAQGMSAPQVAHFLGDGTRTVEYWVKRFNAEGLSGLVEGDPQLFMSLRIEMYLKGQIKLDPINDDIPFLAHSEPHPLPRSSVGIVKREATITTGCPRTACMSRIRNLHIGDSLAALTV